MTDDVSRIRLALDAQSVEFKRLSDQVIEALRKIVKAPHDGRDDGAAS